MPEFILYGPLGGSGVTGPNLEVDCIDVDAIELHFHYSELEQLARDWNRGL